MKEKQGSFYQNYQKLRLGPIFPRYLSEVKAKNTVILEISTNI